MRQYRAEGRETKSRRGKNATLKFVGCDGEGATLDNGYHAYNLLRIGDEYITPEPGAVRLTTWQCLDFIASRDPKAIYVGYYFDYDVTKILEDLPFERLWRLLSRPSRMTVFGQLMPIDWRDFQIEYLPRKEFKVRRKLITEDGWSPWIVINEVGPFFQTSFLQAIKLWKVGTEDEWTAIESGKRQRATFSVADFDEIAAYNLMEIVLLQQLMERFRDACLRAGYVPSKWQGPGLLAEAMFRKHGVPLSKDVPLLQENPGLVQFATNAYYGGRFEISAIGPVNQPVYQYDINSAYPYAMQFVPCLLHGKWEHVTDYATWSERDVQDFHHFDRPRGMLGERFALMHGTFTHRGGPNALWYGLPMRTKSGTIVYPESGAGWYWSFEVNSAIHQAFQPDEMWVYTRQCSCRPLAFVAQVYETRQAIGKDGPGIVLKLGLNSLYGKTVQSIGFPKYANPIWGSFITAFPRVQIQDFLHSSPLCFGAKNCGADVVMVATDSVASLRERTEREYADSKLLGGWSKETHARGLFIVQPGVYFGSSGKPSKTRGVPRTIVDTYEPVFRDAFATMVETGDLADGDVAIPQKIFVGIRYALVRRNQKLLGQWIDFAENNRGGKVISFDWTGKRAAWPALGPTSDRSYILTFPYEGSTDISTIPYDKDIGGLQDREEMRAAFYDQPDWSPAMEVYFE